MADMETDAKYTHLAGYIERMNAMYPITWLDRVKLFLIYAGVIVFSIAASIAAFPHHQQ